LSKAIIITPNEILRLYPFLILEQQNEQVSHVKNS
jgi:hypothetical protein